MANAENLKPVHTRAEAQALGRNGGKESGRVRRRKKLLKDCMTDLLQMPVQKREDAERLKKMGTDADDLTNRALLVTALFEKGVTGDVAAFREIRDLIGEADSKSEDVMRQLDAVLEKIGGKEA